MITQFTDTLSDEKVEESINKSKPKEFCIGSLESTEENLKEHRHIVLIYDKEITFQELQELYPKSHIEELKGTLRQAYKYATKDGKALKTNMEFELTEAEQYEEVMQMLWKKKVYSKFQ